VSTTAVVNSALASDYALGDDHPLSPLRYRLAAELLGAYGFLDRSDVEVIDPTPARDEEILRVHAPAYVAAVRRYGADPGLAAAWEAAQWGLAAGGDTPAFAGMHEAGAAVCGAALAAAAAVWEGRADRAFCAGGGLHHALANRAAGFCVYNDCAVAIQALLDAGAERVAYIDVDGHHGDGTQWIFYEDPRVLTCSVHESGRWLFPGTGGLAERGSGPGLGSALNVPLPAFAGDRPYVRAVEEVFAPAVRAFGPDVLVTHNSSDAHHADPLTHLQVTMDGLGRVHRILADLADEAAGGRLVALAGAGGYAFDVAPRACALNLAAIVDAAPADEIPPAWLAAARERTGRDFTGLLRADAEPQAPADARSRADEEGDRIVDQAVALVR
jgi:acetoin utilization protein AcuC